MTSVIDAPVYELRRRAPPSTRSREQTGVEPRAHFDHRCAVRMLRATGKNYRRCKNTEDCSREHPWSKNDENDDPG
jgi:hypothetical protein